MEHVCKHCKSKMIIKKGKTRTRHQEKQIYYCKECKRKFVDTSLANKTYPPRIICSAISAYNLGLTLQETRKQINKRFKITLPTSTLHDWIQEFKPICSIQKLRKTLLKYASDQILEYKPFVHNGLQYNFKYHKPNL